MSAIDGEKVLEWLSKNGFGVNSLDYTLTSFRDCLINEIESGAFNMEESKQKIPQFKKGEEVRHKKDRSLVKGIFQEVAKSGKRALVHWKTKDNPRLNWSVKAYYRLDLLEKVESDHD